MLGGEREGAGMYLITIFSGLSPVSAAAAAAGRVWAAAVSGTMPTSPSPTCTLAQGS